MLRIAHIVKVRSTVIIKLILTYNRNFVRDSVVFSIMWCENGSSIFSLYMLGIVGGLEG